MKVDNKKVAEFAKTALEGAYYFALMQRDYEMTPDISYPEKPSETVEVFESGRFRMRAEAFKATEFFVKGDNGAPVAVLPHEIPPSHLLSLLRQVQAEAERQKAEEKAWRDAAEAEDIKAIDALISA